MTPPNNIRVAVAMSGGVDSSVAAALLVQRGFDVFGLMMRLWSEPSEGDSTSAAVHNHCCTPDAMAQARNMAAQLDIPFYVLNTQDVFKRNVVDFFIEGYASGVTPNPCLECNRHIRWDFLLNKALDFGATHLATGHYARVVQTNEEFELQRAVDSHKDQSYVLSVLGQDQLQHAIFPIGDYTKDEVRALAREFDLPVSERRDSQDLCFLADNDYRRFLREYAPNAMRAGAIVDTAGNQVGEHTGLAGYTIGQRKGLGIAAPEPLYVLETNTKRNELVVGTLAELGGDSLHASEINWIHGAAPADEFRADVKIRYRSRALPAKIALTDSSAANITFDEPVRDITPGQAAVIYAGEVCLGGGIIQS